MPFLRLTLASANEFDDASRQRLQSGLTRLMASTLRKDAALTVVAVEQAPPGSWSVAGAALGAQDWSAQLEVFITDGSNTAAERRRFIAEANALILAESGRPAQAPLYVVLHQVPGDSWGYDGETQAQRHASRQSMAAN
ncbi:tautomerase family protein [Ideonella azotifigens]|uniref:4-oxalocrotonate tautomerase n=1 Tax=Ideonella azotifigens TaxID=513160 RepID=A0ABN1JSQ4_9BURK|nr:tautomerase family protein [Ideonella azotifigens]MCD2340946.1 tautomerase family protein [Ideonella azotifigens]